MQLSYLSNKRGGMAPIAILRDTFWWDGAKCKTGASVPFFGLLR